MMKFIKLPEHSTLSRMYSGTSLEEVSAKIAETLKQASENTTICCVDLILPMTGASSRTQYLDTPITIRYWSLNGNSRYDAAFAIIENKEN